MQRSVYHVTQLEWPTDWEAFFGRPAPLLLEIGFGGGHFITDLAVRHPEANILGVEISNPSIRRTHQKLGRLGAAYVQLIYGDARALLWAGIGAGALSGVFVNFPDPWPKPGHGGRRLINDPFLHLLATRMESGAQLDIATDHAGYQSWIGDHLTRSPYFVSVTGTTFVTEDRSRPRTKYERQALEAGVTCHYFKYRRGEKTAPNLFASPEVKSMPHAIVATPLDRAAIQDQFAQSEARFGAVTVRLVDLFASSRHNIMLAELFVSEAPQPQHVALDVRLHQAGQWKVAMHDIGFPRSTPGIHAAVAHVATWLASLHEDGHIVRSNLKPPGD